MTGLVVLAGPSEPVPFCGHKNDGRLELDDKPLPNELLRWLRIFR
jgi:hypothetical protein